MFTASSFAALIADGKADQVRDETMLWWNSYNSRDFSSKIATEDYRKLSWSFWHYFQPGG